MDHKVIQILMILLFYPETSAAGVKDVNEGDPVDINCKLPDTGTIVFWFRAVDGAEMELIGSFSTNGQPKAPRDNFNRDFSLKKQMNDFVLTVKSFKKRTDSGLYSCAALTGGNKLTFGPVTQLRGKPKPTTPPPPPPRDVTTRQMSTTPKNCLCNDKSTAVPFMFCSPIVLGSLAGGCGLLLLLLIITVLYCNNIRTRRCPHHYKRKPRTTALEKQMMTNRHI
ncbi:T-cell surface glycoprotein CD8 alpha chain isoform X1 [Fundulus heteroclitus]|uniref:T-cell surface glycoprotein CD8 alpha chain isoform X1 n=1 Tax=Fundulus heteroclitus TaxID=8078 RepID=UPI00165C1CB6|nr:T-cell surface glycoprotein CD8 alpha chain isoform X1 [Fundulus heteroclitus]